jgi:hypothetical protein
MKVVLTALALLALQPATPVSDRVPELNMQALCKARSAGDKFMRLPESQSVADCVQDETDAKQQLNAVWGKTSGSTRKRCQSEAAELGTRSYLDLITCLQMADDVKSMAPAPHTKRTSKKPDPK